MNKYAYEYMENIQENYSFILNNFNLILFFAKSVTNNIDSNTHFWLFKNDNLQYKNTNLKTEEILKIVENFYQDFSKKIGDRFIEDIKKERICFEKDGDNHLNILRSEENGVIEDYRIFIKYTGTILDSLNLVHEYTHLLMEKINVAIERDKSFVDIFDEAAAIYAELLLMNFLLSQNIFVDDLLLAFGNKIGRDVNQMFVQKEVLQVVKMFQEKLSEESIKDKIKNNQYSYEFICNQIINKNDLFSSTHFLGLLIALDIYSTSYSRINDFSKILREAEHGQFSFLKNKLPTNTTSVVSNIVSLRKEFIDHS